VRGKECSAETTQNAAPLGRLTIAQGAERCLWVDRPIFEFDTFVGFPTIGPENRYETVLFIEKEGFEPLLEAVELQKRFDIGIMSTKGMSVVAARKLIDELSNRGIRQVFVLHDFDVSGFSIFGTLGKDNRRYTFRNSVQLIDIGLRLKDVVEMNLESEPATVKGDWTRRSRTLRRHGAMDDEIDFLRTRRVELNAMTSPQMIELIERKFAENHVTKFIPEDEAVIEHHARRTIERQMLERRIEKVRGEISEQARAASIPDDLRERVVVLLAERTTWSWDTAVAEILHDDIYRD
jgi:hypothetical protein